MKQIKEFVNKLGKMLLNEEINKRIVGISTYVILGTVALFMTVLNIVTQKGMLTAATAIFAGLCLLDLIIVLRFKKGVQLSAILFTAEIAALFVFFLISGNPEGFSAIWICLLPSGGMVFYGRKKGSLICGGMLAILIVLLWTPWGQSLLQYDYTATFRMRFPVLFIAFYLTAFFLESLQERSYREVDRLRKLYEDLSAHDPLTKALNRQGMYSELETRAEFQQFSKIGAVMLDIDFFKSVNDIYGHVAGDFVLKEFARLMGESLDAVICRWGGEEFVAIYVEDRVKPEDLERLRVRIENHVFLFEGTQIRATASMGVSESAGLSVREIDRLIENADVYLYEAKNTGRNKIVFKHS